MKTYTLFIWDLDNTLIASSDLLWGAFAYVAKKYAGRNMTPAEIVSMYGPPEDSVVEKLAGALQKEDALADFYRFYQDNHDHLVQLFPGILEIIYLLREKGITQTLFTSKNRFSAEITLKKLGIREYFDVVICGDEVVYPKPFPDGVHSIIHRTKVHPDEILYLGDSPLDKEAAQRAGVDFAYVLWDSFHRDTIEKNEARYVFHTVGEFREWITQMFALVDNE